eukprot:5521438-Pyramimonas_sp.AAC.1
MAAAAPHDGAGPSAEGRRRHEVDRIAQHVGSPVEPRAPPAQPSRAISSRRWRLSILSGSST